MDDASLFFIITKNPRRGSITIGSDWDEQVRKEVESFRNILRQEENK